MTEAGDKEIILASEKVQVQNTQACIDFSNETRKLFRELEEKVTRLENNFLNVQALMEQQKKQLAMLQQQFYTKGSVSYQD
jgi:ribosomal protein L6P/L9E